LGVGILRNIHVFHHSDPDGYVSAGVVKFYNRDAKNTNIYMHAVNYTEHDQQLKLIEESNLKTNDTIYILDFSFDRDVMEKLASEHEDCVWIDHHVTAINKMDGVNIKGVRKVGEAGCLLTWKYFYPEQQAPLFIVLVHMFDVWQNHNKERWENIIRPFIYGLDSMIWDYEDSDNVWDMLFMNSTDTQIIQNIIKDGKVIQKYIQKQNKHTTNKCAFVTLFEGGRAIVANTEKTGSDMFDSVYNPEEHDFMMSFSLTKSGYWAVSLYSTKAEFHVGSIAKKYGGGGHAGAAGFQCEELPFQLVKPKKD